MKLTPRRKRALLICTIGLLPGLATSWLILGPEAMADPQTSLRQQGLSQRVEQLEATVDALIDLVADLDQRSGELAEQVAVALACCHGDPGCEDRCANVAQRSFAACMDRGGNEDDCMAASEDLLRRCLEGCDSGPEPTPACADDCARAADRGYHECLENGGRREECEQAAEQFYQECLQRCDVGL